MNFIHLFSKRECEWYSAYMALNKTVPASIEALSLSYAAS